MARTTSTNFTGGLDFTVATAATDLFVKDDVQILAQAVDQHDHTAGKGLLLPAGAIPAGLITSAMIADGTIATADIAPNAVTQSLSVAGATSTPSTTSATPVDLPEMTITVTTTGGDVLVWLTCPIACTVTSGIIALAVNIDGTDYGHAIGTVAAANQTIPFTVATRATGLSPGAHSVKGKWSTTAGTITAFQVHRYLVVEELKR